MVTDNEEINAMHATTKQNAPAEEEFVVVVNDEEQYSIWSAERAIPDGWRPEGMRGSKAECLAHIDVVWTDMRPLSLRRRMAEAS